MQLCISVGGWVGVWCSCAFSSCLLGTEVLSNLGTQYGGITSWLVSNRLVGVVSCIYGCGILYLWVWYPVSMGVVSCICGCGILYLWVWNPVSVGVVSCIYGCGNVGNHGNP